MLENSSSDAPAAASIATVKRYTPPNQRNRSIGRRKSGGERLERANSNANDIERNTVGATKDGTLADHGDFGCATRTNESFHAKLVPLRGCCNSEASQLLNNRWTAVLNAHNSLPDDSAERPVLYARKRAAPWGQANPPHLMIQQPSGGSGMQKDFLSELRQAMDNASRYS